MGADRTLAGTFYALVSVVSGRPPRCPNLLGLGVRVETDASFVAAGVDTRKDVHVLCVIDALGRKVREGAFPATTAGYRDLADAIGAPGKCLVVGIEGTCSFGAGPTAHLASSGFNVVEVLRPKRDKRRKGASKNDFVDAERAARTAIAGDGTSIPKSRDGWAEAARPALRAREILVRTQTQVTNAVKALLNTAPEPVRGKYATNPNQPTRRM